MFLSKPVGLGGKKNEKFSTTNHNGCEGNHSSWKIDLMQIKPGISNESIITKSGIAGTSGY